MLSYTDIIRNEIFPLIAKKFPDYENALIRLSENAREDNDYNISANGRGLCEFYSGNGIDCEGGIVSITDNIFTCYAPTGGKGAVLDGCDFKSVIIEGNTINLNKRKYIV